MSLWVLFEYVLYFTMIENYKGWDITLNWDNSDYLKRDSIKSNFFNPEETLIRQEFSQKCRLPKARIIRKLPLFVSYWKPVSGNGSGSVLIPWISLFLSRFQSSSTPCPGRSGTNAWPSEITSGSVMKRSRPKPWTSRKLAWSMAANR